MHPADSDTNHSQGDTDKCDQPEDSAPDRPAHARRIPADAMRLSQRGARAVGQVGVQGHWPPALGCKLLSSRGGRLEQHPRYMHWRMTTRLWNWLGDPPPPCS